MLLFLIGLYLLSNVAVGVWATRRVTTSQDFVLAGRRLPLVLAASVTFATWFGSETIMGAPAMFVKGGIPAVIEEPFGSALCLFLVGAFFARPLYRLRITTFCDYFRIRFGRSAELLSAVLTIPSYFGGHHALKYILLRNRSESDGHPGCEVDNPVFKRSVG